MNYKTFEIWKNGEYLNFERDHGSCYGGVRKTTLDCQGKTGKKLYKHIKEYVGKDYADAARKKGYC